VFIPAALGGVLTKERAEALRADVIIEAANAPTTLEGEEILQRRSIPIIPDILANAGGVTVSYFEWVQNVQQFRWDGDRVNNELRALMTKAYRAVSQLTKTRNLSWRTATYVLALERVAKATFLRGVQ
jgi:glutamate dehydrogenase (NAD(P)+)